MDINVDGKKGKFKKLDSTPPPGAKRSKSVMTMEAIVDTTMQPLRAIRPFAAACLYIPSNLSNDGQTVLRCLFDCFDKANEVKEGKIDDFVWGFAQSGHDPRRTVGGLNELRLHGYVKFQAPDNSYVGFDSAKIEDAWIRYQPKLLDMVYQEPVTVKERKENEHPPPK